MRGAEVVEGTGWRASRFLCWWSLEGACTSVARTDTVDWIRAAPCPIDRQSAAGRWRPRVGQCLCAVAVCVSVCCQPVLLCQHSTCAACWQRVACWWPCLGQHLWAVLGGSSSNSSDAVAICMHASNLTASSHACCCVVIVVVCERASSVGFATHLNIPYRTEAAVSWSGCSCCAGTAAFCLQCAPRL